MRAPVAIGLSVLASACSAIAFAWRSQRALCATLLGGLVAESLVPASTAIVLGAFAAEVQDTLAIVGHGYERALLFLGGALLVAGASLALYWWLSP